MLERELPRTTCKSNCIEYKKMVRKVQWSFNKTVAIVVVSFSACYEFNDIINFTSIRMITANELK